MERKLHKIKLYGSLGKTYGFDSINIYASSTKEVFQALVSRFGITFRQTILDNAWHITSGKRVSKDLTKEDNFLQEQQVDFPLEHEELHIFPAISGAGGKGTGQIILGVVLIIVAVILLVIPGGQAGGALLLAQGAAPAILVAGIASVASGIATMLTKTPSLGDYSDVATDQKQSFIFNGAVNNTEQGVPVPLVYGIHLTGSTIISAGMDVEQL